MLSSEDHGGFFGAFKAIVSFLPFKRLYTINYMANKNELSETERSEKK